MKYGKTEQWIDRMKSEGGRYRNLVVALSFVALATVLNLLVWPAGPDQDGHYFALLAAVLASAFLRGLWAGFAAAVLGGLSSAFFSLSPQFSINVASPSALERLAVFLIEGVLLSLIIDLIRNQREMEVPPSRWIRYAEVPLAVGAATLPKLIFSDLATNLPFAFNFTAIFVCARAGGIVAGAVATALLAGLTRYLFLQPPHSLAMVDHAETLRVGLFMTEGLLLTLLGNLHAKLRRLATNFSIRARAYMAAAVTRNEDTVAMRAISRDTIWEWELDTGEIIRTPSWEDALSSVLPQREDFVSWVERIHPEDRHMTITRLHRAIEEGRQELQYTYRLITPKGDILSVADHAFVVRGVDWKPLRVIGRSAELHASAG